MTKLKSSIQAFNDARAHDKALKLCEEWVALTPIQLSPSNTDSLLALAHALQCYQRTLGNLARYSEAISVNVEAQKYLVDVHVQVLYPDESYTLLECC